MCRRDGGLIFLSIDSVWTWAVARIGGLDGVWTSASREKLARLLHLDLAVEARVATVPAFNPAERPTTTAPLLASNLAELGLPLPDASNVTFCTSRQTSFYARKDVTDPSPSLSTPFSEPRRPGARPRRHERALHNRP